MKCPKCLVIASFVTCCLLGSTLAQNAATGDSTKDIGSQTATVRTAPTVGTEASSSKKPKSTTYYVSTSQAYVYSGPSQDFYPCGILPRGKAVEAYHQTEDGWLAIAPPEGSFSWILAKDAYLLPGGRVIEITTNNAVSWIGTSLGTAKQFRWQVRLNRGEQLAVLGEQTIEESGKKGLWYKVAPPSGEFRWLNQEATSQSPPKVMLAAAQGPTKQNASHPKPLPEKKIRSLAKSDADTSPKTKSQVRTAAAQMPDDVFGDNEMIRGEIISGDYEALDGQMVYGENEIIDGEVIVDPTHHQHVLPGEHLGDRWDGWHAFNVPTPHFRIPFLHNLFTPKQLQHDPLNHDPFSLAMAKPVPVPQRVETIVTEPVGVLDPARRRHTPWRDPRSLREQRIKGRPNLASTASRPAELMEKIAARFSTLQDRLGPSSGNVSYEKDPGQDLNQPEARSGIPSSLASYEKESGTSAYSPNAKVGPSSVNWYGTSSPAQSPATNPPVSTGSNQLAVLTAEVSEIVAGPVQNWRFESLTGRVQALVENGADPVTRGQARLLLERIQQFQELGRKSGFSAPIAKTPTNQFASSNQNAPVTTASYSKPNGQSLYDATGWLVPVHSAAQLQAGNHRPTPGQPSFALADDQGRIVVYLTAVNGLRLDSYVNKAVGVHGLRGYLPQLQAGHIQASRISELR